MKTNTFEQYRKKLIKEKYGFYLTKIIRLSKLVTSGDDIIMNPEYFFKAGSGEYGTPIKMNNGSQPEFKKFFADAPLALNLYEKLRSDRKDLRNGRFGRFANMPKNNRHIKYNPSKWYWTDMKVVIIFEIVRSDYKGMYRSEVKIQLCDVFNGYK